MPLFNLLEAAVANSEIVSGVKAATDAVTSQFNISTIVSLLGIVMAACVGLFLFWWGVRQVIARIQKSFKGKGM